MTTVITIIRHTPIWVFPLIALVLWRGAVNLRQRKLSLRSLFVFPILMLGLSVGNSIGTSAPQNLALADWLGCAAIGMAIGWSLTRDPVAIDPIARKVTLDGSVVPLLVSAGIVLLRYCFGYLYGRYPELRADHNYAFVLIGAGALFGGVTFGRYGKLGFRYRQYAIEPKSGEPTSADFSRSEPKAAASSAH